MKACRNSEAVKFLCQINEDKYHGSLMASHLFSPLTCCGRIKRLHAK